MRAIPHIIAIGMSLICIMFKRPPLIPLHNRVPKDSA
jgi:hypothetical protein